MFHNGKDQFPLDTGYGGFVTVSLFEGFVCLPCCALGKQQSYRSMALGLVLMELFYGLVINAGHNLIQNGQTGM